MTRARIPLFSVFLISTFILIATAILPGCSLIARKATEKAVEKAVEKATGKETDVEVDERKVKVKTEEGETQFEAGGKIPEDFPKDFPVYKGARVEGVIRTESGGKVQFNIEFATDDDFSKVVTFYKDKLPKAGYKISVITETDEGVFLNLVKGGGSVGMVEINKEKDKTVFTVTLVE